MIIQSSIIVDVRRWNCVFSEFVITASVTEKFFWIFETLYIFSLSKYNGNDSMVLTMIIITSIILIAIILHSIGGITKMKKYLRVNTTDSSQIIHLTDSER